MARPARRKRSTSARPSRQLSRFYRSINSDMVFGTHRVSPSTSTLCAFPLTLMAKAMTPSPFVPGGPARRYGRAGISFFKATTISFSDKGFRFSNQVEDSVDIAARSLRVRTELFCLLHQLLGNVARDTWQADVKAGAEKITGVCQVQV